MNKIALIKSIFKLANEMERDSFRTRDVLGVKIGKILDDAVMEIVSLGMDERDQNLMLRKLREELAAFQEGKGKSDLGVGITLEKIYIDPDDEPIVDAEKIYLKDDPDNAGRYPLFKGKNKLNELKESGFNLDRPLSEDLYELVPMGKKSRRGYVPERRQRQQKRRKRF